MSGVGGWEGAVSVPCNAVCVLDPNFFVSFYFYFFVREANTITNHMNHISTWRTRLYSVLLLLSFVGLHSLTVTEVLWLVALASVLHLLPPENPPPGAAPRAERSASTVPQTAAALRRGACS